MCTAKGITGAYVPLGLAATTDEIADYFDDHYFAHGHTYEAHPLTLAPATAAIREYKRLGLIERSRAMGETLGVKLAALKEKHPSVGDVRGRGLFYAVELVKDRAHAKVTTPFNTQEEKLSGKPLMVDQVTAKMMSLGVSCLGWVSHLVVAPPLIVTEAELDEGLRALDEALSISDAALS